MRPGEPGGGAGGTTTTTKTVTRNTPPGLFIPKINRKVLTEQGKQVAARKAASPSSASDATNTIRYKSATRLLTNRDVVGEEESRSVESTSMTETELVGRPQDTQRSRLRYVNRNLPPLYMSIAQYGRRIVPRRWR